MVEPASFNLCEVEQAIADSEFAGSAVYLPTVASTNDLALEAARAGARRGVWIAGEQTAGRGRGSHTWHSSLGDGLYMSALISPPIPMQSTLKLSFKVAIAVQSAIASVTGFRIRDQIDIRWPNDLLLNGKKCGGILIETAAQPSASTGPAMLRYAVIGIGVNCNHLTFPPELDAIATSLRRELPDPTPPLRLEHPAAAILLTLNDELRRLLAESEERSTENATCELTKFSTWISGKRVRVEARDGYPSYTGTIAGLNPDGFLLVVGDDSELHTVLSGGLREP